MKKHIWAVGLAIVVTGLLAACASPQQRAERQALRNVKEALANMEKMRKAPFPPHHFPPNSLVEKRLDLEALLGCAYGEDNSCYSKNFKYKEFCNDEACYVMAVHKDEIYFLEAIQAYEWALDILVIYDWSNHCLCDASSELGCKICASLEDYN